MHYFVFCIDRTAYGRDTQLTVHYEIRTQAPPLRVLERHACRELGQFDKVASARAWIQAEVGVLRLRRLWPEYEEEGLIERWALGEHGVLTVLGTRDEFGARAADIAEGMADAERKAWIEDRLEEARQWKAPRPDRDTLERLIARDGYDD